MSLINQMLKDLEHREKIHPDPEVTLSGLLSTDSPSYYHNRKKFSLGMSLVFLVSAIFLLVTHQFKHRSHALANQLDVFTHVKRNFSEMDADDASSQPIKEAPATLTGISLDTNNDITEMRFFLNRETSYRVASNANQTQLILTLDHSTLTADLPPVDYLKSAIQGMEMTNDSDGNLKITLTLHPGASVNYLDLVSGNKSPELQMKLVYHPPVSAPKSPPTFYVKKTDEFNAKLQYENAMNMANLGDRDKAIASLNELTDEYPNFVTARQSLISMLLQQGSKIKARKVLEEGLQQKPYYPPFIEIKARLLVNEGKIIQALDLLERAPPPMETNPDYHAFIAALYRELGKAPRALHIYSQLVQINPSSGQYWAGLGIALESTGKSAEAKEVYEHATQLSNLSPPLRSYLETRIENIS